MTKRWSAGVVFCMWLLGACAESAPPSEPKDAAAPDAAEPIVLPDDVAGKPCETDTDCRPGRCAGMLRLAESADPVPAPGGYCTADCEDDSQCGDGSECLVASRDCPGVCIAGCATDADCREAYDCIGAVAGAVFELRGGCRPRYATPEVADDAVGRACSEDAECGGGACTETTPLGMPFPGNYCSARCYEDAQCGAGAACLAYAGGSEPGRCYQTCASSDDCTRDGYACRRIGVEFDACYPAPDPLPDGTAGSACDSDDRCGGGTCYFELPFGSFVTWEDLPAPGGYCSQPCSLDIDCGAGAKCISRGYAGGMCVAVCAEDTECREGYSCLSHLRDGDPDDKACVPTVPLR